MDAGTSTFLNRVRVALLTEWDPIGIQEIPEAHDEYDSYAPDICELLMGNQTIDSVFDYLWQLETDHMGLTGDQMRTRAFAEQLIRMKADFV